MYADRYYRHSGTVPPLGLLKALALGLLVSVPAAFVYAYILVYLPIIGVITFILTAGFGGIVGFAVGAVMHKGKVRNNTAALAAAVPVALFALWASWVAWVYALLHRADAEVGVLDLALNPAALAKVILLINEKGSWSFKGATPTGGALWVMWALEAAIIVGLILFVAREAVSSPFCEACDRWCEEHKGLAYIGPTHKDVLVPRLEKADYAILVELEGPSGDSFTQLDLHQCSQCQGNAALTATSVTVKLKKGKQEKEEKVLLRHLVLSPSELSTVKETLARAQPPQEVVAPG
jgi:hypothetical protein